SARCGNGVWSGCTGLDDRARRLPRRVMAKLLEPSEQLLDLIYDAASEPGLWRQVLTEISLHTHCIGGFMIGFTPEPGRPRSVEFYANAGMSETSHRIYRERHLVNPWSVHMSTAQTGKFVQSAAVLPIDDLKRTAFFDEVLRPQGVGYDGMAILEKG